MNKKLMLLALGAISAMMLAVPAFASAEPVHVVPQPVGAKTIHGGASELRAVGGTFVRCNTVTGSATWENTTTGIMSLTFSGNCLANGFLPCNSIVANNLPFHLVTLPGKVPGVLITAPAAGHFATFSCSGLASTVEGNGIIGTITAPKCAAKSSTATIVFETTTATSGIQKHKTLSNTAGTYNLKRNGEEAGMNAEATVSMGAESPELVCT